MNIYVDFDDCLCETARYFCGLADRMFGVNVPYDKVRFFDLQKSFSLDDDQYDKLMIAGHTPEVLLAYDETPGACSTLREWIDEGINVSIITGRPVSTFEPSREWLDTRGLEGAKLYCLNKYGRDAFLKGSSYSLELDDYYKMHFDYAVEDSPRAFGFFSHLPELKVIVIDRPWNRDCEFPEGDYNRCSGWDEIRAAVKG